MVEELTSGEILSIMGYIKDIVKLQYKTVIKNTWTNIVGVEALAKLAVS